MEYFCPFGYLDIKRALEVICEAEGVEYISSGVLYDLVSDVAENLDVAIEDIDPVYCVYEAYYQEARTQIEEITGKDIVNDEPFSSLYISANYLATSFDATEEVRKAVVSLIESIKEEDRTSQINWLLDELS